MHNFMKLKQKEWKKLYWIHELKDNINKPMFWCNFSKQKLNHAIYLTYVKREIDVNVQTW
jgi:hypothetical protein